MKENGRNGELMATGEIPPELAERLRQVEEEAAAENRFTAAFLGKYITCGTIFTALLVFPAVLFFLLIPEKPISPSAAVMIVLGAGIAGGLLTGIAAAVRPRQER